MGRSKARAKKARKRNNVPAKSISKTKKRQQNKNNRKLRDIYKIYKSYILQDKSLLKYWQKRFSLFSRFDEGICLDRESWYSVTPEQVAINLAKLLACDILIDGFCGCGGNTIQFAKTCHREMAKHNADIYGVAEKIDFIIGDFFQLCTQLRGNIVFLSPPWGGPRYKYKRNFNIEKCLLPVGASTLVQHARQISENIALYLPRKSNIKQIKKIAGINKPYKVKPNYLDSRVIGITALYGEEILQSI